MKKMGTKTVLVTVYTVVIDTLSICNMIASVASIGNVILVILQEWKVNQMGYKVYSDSHLMSLTKAQIIELLRVAEHNFFTTEEALNNSAKAGMEIAEKYDRAKELLKAAIEDINFNTVCLNFDTCKVCAKRYNISCKEKFKWHYTDEAKKLIES